MEYHWLTEDQSMSPTKPLERAVGKGWIEVVETFDALPVEKRE
jgi:hypothetical protein